MNKSLIVQNSTVTMTSIEIAELTGKEHRNVTADIEAQLSKVCSLLNFQQSYTTSRGKSYKMYRLPKRETLILVSGYSVELRAKIIDRLNELEQGYIKPLPHDYLSALRALLISEEEKRMLEFESLIDKPKVRLADAIIASDDTIPVGDFAKILKQNGINIGRQRLFDILRNSGLLIKYGSSRNIPTQRAMQLGLFKINETTVTRSAGNIQIIKSPKITGKGQLYLSEYFLNNIEVLHAK